MCFHVGTQMALFMLEVHKELHFSTYSIFSFPVTCLAPPMMAFMVLKRLKCEFPIDVPPLLFESLSSSSVSLLSLFFLSHVIEWINASKRVFFFP